MNMNINCIGPIYYRFRKGEMFFELWFGVHLFELTLCGIFYWESETNFEKTHFTALWSGVQPFCVDFWFLLFSIIYYLLSILLFLFNIFLFSYLFFVFLFLFLFLFFQFPFFLFPISYSFFYFFSILFFSFFFLFSILYFYFFSFLFPFTL